MVPTEPFPYDLLGDVYREKGKLEKARDAYTEAAKYSDDDGGPYKHRGHVHTFLGDYEAARADYDKAIATGRDSPAPPHRDAAATVLHARDQHAAHAPHSALTRRRMTRHVAGPTELCRDPSIPCRDLTSSNASRLTKACYWRR